MRKGLFHALLCERLYVRRTISFYNKEGLIFSAGEGAIQVSNACCVDG